MNHHHHPHHPPNQPRDARAGDARTLRPAPPPGPPRKVRGGVRLMRAVDELRRDYRASRWLALAERVGSEEAFSEGLTYANAGQALSLDAQPGQVSALVQGTRRSPYKVVIELPSWSEADWQRAIEVIAREPSLFADVLVGDASQRLCAALERSGLSLLPTREEAIATRCECAAKTRCKHVAAVMILLAQRALDDPAFLTLLRGVSMESLVDRLQQERGIEARGAVAAHPEPGLDVLALAAPPLEDSLESFWSSPGDAPDAVQAGARHASHALLRRLGPSPLPGRFPIVGLLASIYDEVSARAKKLLEE